ncbi:MAG: AraC family transcriptional regulator [Spirochaetales bacterium]
MIVNTPLTFYYSGYEKTKSGHSFGPTIRYNYILHFVLSGKGIFRIGKKIFHVEKNHGFLICPNDITYYEADIAEPWEYVWLGFDGFEAERILKNYGLNRENPICVPQDELKMAAYLSQSLDCFKNPQNTYVELTGWFYLFFSCLKGFTQELPVNKTNVQNAIEYMRANYMNDINIDEISSSLGIDRTYLYKICKAYTNMSPKEFLTKQRIAAAKDMLLHSNNNITEIALSCGFHDSSSFSRIFHKYEHISPSDYRKKLQKDYVPDYENKNSKNFIKSKIIG